MCVRLQVELVSATPREKTPDEMSTVERIEAATKAKEAGTAEFKVQHWAGAANMYAKVRLLCSAAQLGHERL